jgi:proteic killer suppression protein
VEINFESKELARRCSEKKQRVRAWGSDGAKKVNLRLQQLQAARTLADMRALPGRCHELKGERAGHLSIDLHHPYRLVFRPTADPPPIKDDGGLDWTEVDAVTVMEIVDYH